MRPQRTASRFAPDLTSRRLLRSIATSSTATLGPILPPHAGRLSVLYPRYPHQFSGGQRQRIAVARALLARPELLVAHQSTFALDVSVQAQVLNLLRELQDAFGLALLFVSRDLAVVRQMADRVVVLRRGRIVESAEVEAFFVRPGSEYGRELLRLTPWLELLAPAGEVA